MFTKPKPFFLRNSKEKKVKLSFSGDENLNVVYGLLKKQKEKKTYN